MADLTLEDLMKRATAGQVAGAGADPGQYDDVLKLLADSGVTPDPTEDAALKGMLEDQGSAEAAVLADAVEEAGSQPLADRTRSMLKDSALRKLYESGERPAARAVAETMEDLPPPAPVVAPPRDAGTPAPDAPAALETTPEVVAKAQANPEHMPFGELAVGQPPDPTRPAASPYTGVDAAKDEQLNQEARRAAHAERVNKFIAEHPEAVLENKGELEKKFREEYGEEYGGNKWLAALTPEGTALYEQRRGKWNEGREKARAADLETAKQNKKISNAMIGLIARTNPSIPIEAIANLTEGDPLIKLMGQGGLGQDEKLRLKLLDLVGTGIKTTSSERNELAGDQARVEAAQIAANAKKGGGGGGGPGAPVTRAGVMAQDMTAQNVPMTVTEAEQAFEGKLDLSKYTPDQRAQIERQVNMLKYMSGKEFGDYRKRVAGREPQFQSGEETAISRQERNVKDTYKARNEVIAQRQAVTEALDGWETLTPAARTLIVQYGDDEQGLLDALKASGLTGTQQAAMRRIQRLINRDIKTFSGSAVTGNEWVRMAKDMGLTSGKYNPYRSPDVLGDFLKTAYRTYKLQRASAEASWPDLWKGFGDGGAQ